MSCARCALSRQQPIVYTFLGHCWDVAQARALVSTSRKGQMGVMDTEALVYWLSEHATLDAQHLGHIPLDRLDEPGIIATLDGQSILIDGSHRAAIAAARGRTYRVYILSPAEQRACERSTSTWQINRPVVRSTPAFPTGQASLSPASARAARRC